MRNWIRRWIPDYAWIPLISLLLLNAITYFGSRIFTTSLVHHDITTPLDAKIPFVPFFIVFYVLAYVQWITGFIIIARESEQFCYRYLSAELLAKLLCLLIFVVYPTTMVRPEITGDGFFHRAVRLLYSVDPPDNLFPSIHCLESWLICRTCVKLTKPASWYKPLSFTASLCVFLSTVLIHQHLIADVFGGIAAVEAGLFLAGKLKAERIFPFLSDRLFHGGDRRGSL